MTIMTKSSIKRKFNPDDYVTKAECLAISGNIMKELQIIKKALVGDDMRGGLVKDVSDLKKERSTGVEITKTVVMPIVIAIITAIIIRLLPF